MEEPDFSKLFSKDPKVKYGFAKELVASARDKPAELYPSLDFFIRLLENENKILKWTAIDIIVALAKIGDTQTIDKLTATLFELLNAGNLIAANHAIAALSDIALAKPEYQAKITTELLRVENFDYETEECQNIAVGKVILAISTYFNKLEDKKSSIEFVRRQTQNSRNATRKKAEQFLRKYNRQN